VPKPKEVQQARDAAAIAAASHFVVNWFLGAGQWEREEAPSLGAARAMRDARGRDDGSRVGMIYAVTRSNQTIFVE
jgi:hypothetical protein